MAVVQALNMALHKNFCNGKKPVRNKAVNHSPLRHSQRAAIVQTAEAKAPGRPNCTLKGAYKKSWRGTST